MAITENIKAILPSGRMAKVNELLLEDLNRLAEGGARQEDAMFDILGQRVIIDPDSETPRKFDPYGSPIGDLYVATVLVRRVTHGDELDWEEKCDACGKPWEANLDLSEFKIKPIKYTVDGSLYDGVDPKTLQFLFKLSRPHQEVEVLRCCLFKGDAQAAIVKIGKSKKDARITELTKMRIIGFEEQYNPADKDLPIESRRLLTPTSDWLKSLPFRSLQEIGDVVEDFDGGIDSTVDIECVHCGHQKKIEVPVTHKNFLFPKSRKRRY